MIVISLTDCPPKVRGDLSKWLLEISTGVFVGNLSARVRDELWNRLCSNMTRGRAAMVFSSQGEQHMDFRVHNTNWEILDFDGLKLVRRPAYPVIQTKRISEEINETQSLQRKKEQEQKGDYTVIDLETTGLKPDNNEIIELGALRVRQFQSVEEFSCLVSSSKTLPVSIIQLTGITNEMLQEEGRDLNSALDLFFRFIGSDKVVCHNAFFDFAFLRAACKSCKKSPFSNPYADTLTISRRKILQIENYQLHTLARHFSLDVSDRHRALVDCHLTHAIYTKLNEL